MTVTSYPLYSRINVVSSSAGGDEEAEGREEVEDISGEWLDQTRCTPSALLPVIAIQHTKNVSLDVSPHLFFIPLL
ncbi:hypothetical protein SESBI_35835 [Sesbania bispinosa]|nr:hypothetical protein SESBI_35835 [Sesbania bispinosa]